METDPGYPETPELDKMSEHTDDSQKIGNFLDWMTQERKLVIAQYVENDEVDWPVPVCLNINDLLAEYYGVNLKKVEEERRDILHYLRGRWKDEPAPEATMTVKAGDDVETITIEGDSVEK